MEDRPRPSASRRNARRKDRRRLPRLFGAGGFCLLLALVGIRGLPFPRATAQTPTGRIRKATAAAPAQPASRGTPETMRHLQEQLRAMAAEAPARSAAIYVKDLISGNTAGANPNREFLAASLIKLPVMGATYAEWEAHPEKKTRNARTWMEWMITVSDNASTDRLISVAGGPEVVLDFCEERGWPNFRVSHGIYAHRRRRDPNICTAREVTEFLAALDRRELVSPAADEEMWEVMCRSKKLLRIPAGVPKLPGVKVGNKSGTLSNVLHDAAIVHTPTARYALCVLLSGHRGEYRGNRFCRDVSRLVFETLHGPVETPPGDAELITTSARKAKPAAAGKR